MGSLMVAATAATLGLRVQPSAGSSGPPSAGTVPDHDGRATAGCRRSSAAGTPLFRSWAERRVMPEAPEPDPDRVQDRAERRQHERTQRVEDMVEHAGGMLAEHEYPTSSEELAADYADEPLDLPNETESLGSVFDRMVDERYESAAEAREALYNELTGAAGPDAEYDEERDLERLDERSQDDVADSGASDM